jgi:predicted dithiol-disulfide oxidoreductase (DUF899 family)
MKTQTMPMVVDHATWQAELDALRIREKTHTHEGDAIAAARRRLPMVEADPTIPLVGAEGPVTLLDAFEGRRQLIAYFHMWNAGRPAAEQCEGCTFYANQVRELSYLHTRDITYATFAQGPYEETVRYRDFMGWEIPWYSVLDSAEALLTGRTAGMFHLVCYLRDGDRVFETYWTNGRGVEVMDNNYALLDLTVYGRQEEWEDSPPVGQQTTTCCGPTAAPPRSCRVSRQAGPTISGDLWHPLETFRNLIERHSNPGGTPRQLNSGTPHLVR